MPEDIIDSKGRNLFRPKMELLNLKLTEADLAAPFNGSEASSSLGHLQRENPVVKVEPLLFASLVFDQAEVVSCACLIWTLFLDLK